ncbi:hypothetical protein EU538_11815 [Candidatus Thorarchaeota archaeon]|nr:MAG: hypothetical protein EU538_11815 [Candidatus Thorarchaeota archaeon]
MTEMLLIVKTKGSAVAGRGEWDYTIEYEEPYTDTLITHSNEGAARGTTSRQMKLMAILRGLEHAKSLEVADTIIIRSDCEWCVKCLTREYDCVTDDEFKTDKVTRGYVQYIREIWWKASGLDVRFEVIEDSSNGSLAG